MPAERVPVGERRGPVPERLEQPVAGDHRADGGVPAGHPLGAGDDVGHVAEVVAGEHRPDPPERADHLVGDEQHVVLVADLPHPLEVAGRRREAAAGVLDRLEEDRGHGVRPLELDRLGDPVRRPQPEGLGVVAQVLRRPVVVGVGHLEGAGHQRLEHLLGRRDAGDREGALRGAVVGDGPADDLVLGRLPGQLEELLGQLPGGLDRLTAAGREEHPVEVARCPGRETLGELDGARVRIRPEREEGELLRLGGRRLGELGPAVPDLDHEQAGQPVDVLLAPVVPDPVPFAPDDERRPGPLRLPRGMPGEVAPEVVTGGVRVRRAGRGMRRAGGFGERVGGRGHSWSPTGFPIGTAAC